MTDDIVGRADYDLGVDDKRLEQGLDAADAKVKSSITGNEKAATDSTGRMTAQTQEQVKRATTAAGAALGYFVAGSVQEFGKFQSGMNEVWSLLPNASKEAMDAMGEQVKAFSKETGKLPDEVIPALYDALSSGVPQDNVFEFLRTANKAAVGGATDAQTAVRVLAGVTNAYGLENLSAARASDILFQTVAAGVTTFPELANNMSDVTPVASSLGVGLDQVGAAIAAMTLQGTRTPQATTAIRQALVELSKDGTKASTVFEKIAGKTFKEFIASGGTLSDALQLMATHASETGLSVNDLFGSVEAAQAALQLTGRGAEQFNDVLGDMRTGTDQTGAAYNKMNQGIIADSKRLVAGLKVMAINVGQSLAGLGPIFTAFGPMAGRALGAGLGAVGGYVAGALVPAILGAQVPAMAAGTTVGGLVGGAFNVAMTEAALLPTRLGLGLLKLGINPAIISSATASGGLAGAAFSAAMGVGIVVGVALIADQVQGPVNDLATDIHDNVVEALGGMDWVPDIGSPDDWPWPLGNKGMPDWAKFKQDAAEGVAGITAATSSGMTEYAGGFRNAWATVEAGAAQHSVKMGTTTADMVAGLLSTSEGGNRKLEAEFRASGARQGAELADGILANRQKPVDAMTKLRQMLKDALSPMAEESRLTGELASKDLRDGLRSHDPAVRQQAIATRQFLLDQLTDLVASSGKLSKGAAANIERGLSSKDATVRANARAAKVAYLNGLEQYVSQGGKLSAQAAAAVERGLKSKNTEIHDAAVRIKNLVTGPLKDLDGWQYGHNLGASFGRGIASSLGFVTRNASNLANAARQYLQQRSPAKAGPLSEDGGTYGWGRKAGLLFAAGLDSSRPAVGSSLAGLMAEGLPAGLLGAGPAAALLGAGSGSFTVGGTARVEFDLTPAAAAALRDAGYSATDVAGELRKGVDLRDLAGTFRHVVAMKGGS